ALLIQDQKNQALSAYRSQLVKTTEMLLASRSVTGISVTSERRKIKLDEQLHALGLTKVAASTRGDTEGVAKVTQTIEAVKSAANFESLTKAVDDARQSLRVFSEARTHELSLIGGKESAGVLSPYASAQRKGVVRNQFQPLIQGSRDRVAAARTQRLQAGASGKVKQAIERELNQLSNVSAQEKLKVLGLERVKRTDELLTTLKGITQERNRELAVGELNKKLMDFDASHSATLVELAKEKEKLA
ncbi:MAG: hypothetical protein KAG66_09315, partial [Methylococcales bacterium]|nr:hypothetical protein [Methylococcales bacterium]